MAVCPSCASEAEKEQERRRAAAVAAALFPSIDANEWAEVSLADLHPKGKQAIGADVAAQKELLENARSAAKKITGTGAARSYGGFGEDRDALWFGKGKPAWHLGVDWNNVEAGTQVASLTTGVVVHVYKDQDEKDGWGGRLIVRSEGFGKVEKAGTLYVLYGHLAPDSLPTAGQWVAKGQTIGAVGRETENGGWFPHVHLQLMTEAYVESFGAGFAADFGDDFGDDFDCGDDLSMIDGYEHGPSMPLGVLDPLLLGEWQQQEEKVRKYSQVELVEACTERELPPHLQVLEHKQLAYVGARRLQAALEDCALLVKARAEKSRWQLGPSVHVALVSAAAFVGLYKSVTWGLAAAFGAASLPFWAPPKKPLVTAKLRALQDRIRRHLQSRRTD